MDTEIFKFVDAGSAPLAKHTFVSPGLEKVRATALSQVRLKAGADGDEKDGDSEADVKFRLNATGNIFTSTTSNDGQVSDEAKALFKSVSVLFSAMTKAMRDANKDLFDYEAWASLIGKSGYFVEMQQFQQTIDIKSSDLSVDTQIVQQLLPGITGGSSLAIAKSVLSAFSGKFSSSSTDEKSKFAHLLFINEEIMGSATVTVRLFFASKTSHTTITQSPCHQRVTKSFTQEQAANTFLFVDPDTIAQYADKYDPEKVPESYKNLIDSLSKLITTTA